MHVLVIAWALPPCRKSGVYRPLAILNELVKSGVEVTALSAARESFSVFYGDDPALEKLIPTSVHMHRVPFTPEHLWPVVNDWPWARVHRPGLWVQELRRQELSSFPEPVYSSWLNPALREARVIHRSRPIDLIVASGNPYVDFEIAFLLHSQEGIPFVLDDRDSFLFATYSGNKSPLFDMRIDRYAEYLSSCVEYWCVNPPLAEAHRGLAGERADRVKVVENGWDPVTIPGLAAGPGGGMTRFGFIGTITPHLPLSALLEAWRAFVDTSARPAEMLVYGDLGFTNDPGSTAYRQAEDIRGTPGVVYKGQVSRLRLSQAYSEVDVLLFAAPGGEFITASKVYEYMATGLPIVALGVERLDALRVLDGYPRLHKAPLNDPHRAARALDNAVRDAADAASSAATEARDYAATWRRDAVLGPAVQRVLGAVS